MQNYNSNFINMCNKYKIKLRKKSPGVVLVATLLITLLLSALSAFFIGAMLQEFKIATSNRSGVVSFYVAESGAEEAIYKIKNDASYITNFQNGTLNTSFTRNPYLIARSSYTVELQSLAPGEAQITSTGIYQAGLLTAQRVIKTKVVKGINPNPPWNRALYGSEEVNIFGSRVNITSGDLLANNDIDIWGFSTVNAGGNVYSHEDINVWLSSTLNVTGEKRAQNFPPAPDPVEMPMIDFDSPNPNSFKNQANQVYTQQQFKDLLRDNPNLTLNGITYVTGDVNVKKGQFLTINGLLVADGRISVGLTAIMPLTDSASLVVNKPADNSMSGLLSKSKIQFGVHSSNISINGLVYSNDQFQSFNFGNAFSVIGGIIARRVQITNVFSQPITITYDDERVSKIIQQENSESPTVQVEHWEESY